MMRYEDQAEEHADAVLAKMFGDKRYRRRPGGEPIEAIQDGEDE